VIVIIRSGTTNKQQGRIRCVLLSCEQGDKYKQCKKDLKAIVSANRKCECPFKLQGKLKKDWE